MSLPDHLRTHRAHLEQLVKLLTQERQLLAEGHIDGKQLGRIASEKQQCLTDLERTNTQQRDTLQSLGYGGYRPGPERAARDAGCLPLWRTTEQLAQEAARLNTLNGELIHLRLEHNQRMLNILREATGHHLYGPDGQSNRLRGQINSRV